MTVASGSPLALAAQLRALGDAELEQLIRVRELRRGAIRDYFGLAEALLDSSSIQAALGRLDRGALALLALAGEQASGLAAATETELAELLDIDLDELTRRLDAASALGLVGRESGRVVPWDAVADQLRAWPSFGLPGTRELVETPAPDGFTAIADDDRRVIDRGAAEHAFAAVVGLAELCDELSTAPARRLSRGGLALPDGRRLSHALGVPPERLDALLEIGVRAGVVAAAPRQWTAAPGAESWRELTRLDRWGRLAVSWLEALPPSLHELFSNHADDVWGDAVIDALSWRYPAGRERITREVDAALEQAELLGIVGAGAPSRFGSRLLGTGVEAAVTELSSHFPAEIERVYLQNDLSIVSPGPLIPSVDTRLRRFADAETRGPASTFRVTAAGVTRALVAGETAQSLLAFLGEISLGPVPQPLDYLVRDTASRFGTLRVGTVSSGSQARAYLRTEDGTLIDQLLVDPRLTPLALAPDADGRLTTRLSREVAYWTLADARYPVVAEDAEGRLLDLDRPSIETAVTADPDHSAALVARLRGTGEQVNTESDEGWIARQLELAIRNRIAVVVRIRMPDGSEPEHLLEPTGLAGGRLRARDRRADIERTLPLSHITAVTPVESHRQE